MKKVVILWVLAFIITSATATSQRITIPTYPLTGSDKLLNDEITYKFARSHGGFNDHRVSIKTNNPNISENLVSKINKTNDEWTIFALQHQEGYLKSKLPHQHSAGKLEYYLVLNNEVGTRKFPSDNSVAIRFKGDVKSLIIILHLIALIGWLVASYMYGKSKNSKNMDIVCCNITNSCVLNSSLCFGFRIRL